MRSESSSPRTGATVFVGGIMQGSKQELAVHDQSYRAEIAAIVRRHHPEVDVIDPAQLHPESVTYGKEQAVATFLDSLERASAADVLIAYLPEASMGTALEIWRAYAAQRPVYVISPMSSNWMLWATATRIFADLDAFASFVSAGGLVPHLQPGATGSS
jgi:hypothetical protein